AAPSGMVTFMDGTTTLGSSSVALSGGAYTATLTTTTLSLGSHSITAVYAGDGNVTGSTSSAVVQVVNNSSTTTSTSLASSANPSVFGQSVTLTATVSAAAGAPTGTVTFKLGTTTLGTAPLVQNGTVFTASLTTSALPVGNDSITATYSGDAS